jgi:UDP-glucose 4,6-dehydratase
LHKGVIGETYNIGSTDEVSIHELHRQLVEAICPKDDKKDWKEHVQDRNFNDQRYNICQKKLKKLGWQQRVPFTEGLRLTVEWYKANPDYFKERS